MEQQKGYGRMISILGQKAIATDAPCLIYKFEPKGYVKLGQDLSLNHENFLAAPAGFSASISQSSEVDDFFMLQFFPDSFAVAAFEYGLDPSELEAVFFCPRVYRETIWINELLHRLRFEMILNEKNDNLCIRFVMAEILKEVYHQSFKNRRIFPIHEPSSLDFLVQKALRLLYRSENFDIDLRTLAATLNVSPSTLTRRFTSAMGQKPGEFLRERRLERAHTLLLTSGLSVAAIARMVGYEETAPFSAAFKKHFNCTPRELRSDGNLRKVDRDFAPKVALNFTEQAWAEPV
jgi:AraC-like DNA-binding protein